MNPSQLQELRMQQMRHQQQTGQRGSGLGLPSSSSSSLTNMGQMGQIGQTTQQQFNQQWMNSTQQQQQQQLQQSRRGSFGNVNANAMALMQQQTGQAMGMGMGMSMGQSAANPMFWNALQGGAKNSGRGLGMDTSGMGMAGSPSAMQAFLQQQQQQQQNAGMSANKNNLMGGSSKTDLSGMGGLGGSMMNQQQQMLNAQFGKMGSSPPSSNSMMNPSSRNDASNQFANSGNFSDQLLFQHQQKMIDDLKRQLAQQGQGQGSGGNNNPSMMSVDPRGSGGGGMMTPQQLMQIQAGANNPMLLSGMMQDPQSRRGSANSLVGNQQKQQQQQQQQQQQRKGSINSNEPISIASLMGGNNQNKMGMSGGSRRSSGTSSNAMGMMGDGNNPGNPNLLMQQLPKGGMDSLVGMGGMNSQQLLAQQQLLSAGLGQSGGQQLNQTGSSNKMVGGLKPELMSSVSASGAGLGAGKSGSTPNDTTPSSSGSSKKEKEGSSSSGQPSFLDGTFNGGWQSNDDIPDRRRVIYSICKVIEQMRPDARQMSQKLPFMAKRLEEHLYRSAPTKEAYLDPSTLKKRLQMIAHGLENKRGSKESKSDAVSHNNKPDSGSGSSPMPSKPKVDPQKIQQLMSQLQQLNQWQQQLHQQQGIGSTNPAMQEIMKRQQLIKEQLLREQAKLQAATQAMSAAGMNSGGSDFGGSSSSQQGDASLANMMNSRSKSSSKRSGTGILKSGSSKLHDPQKKKVIKQQQQRLLLLRHASKCKIGSACKVRFCGQMVSLWKHMKKCRDKSCKTPHCLSSRCVLNHYRICKLEGKTPTCEVCGPVMRQIKQQGSHGDDSRTKDQPQDPEMMQPPLLQQSSSSASSLFGNLGGGLGGVQSMGGMSGSVGGSADMSGLANVGPMANKTMMEMPGMSNTNFSNALGPGFGGNNNLGTNQMNMMSAMGKGNGPMQNMGGGAGGLGISSASADSQKQLQDFQQAQQQLQQQHNLLKQLKDQQAQLLEQQRQLQLQQEHVMPQTPQGQQLQEQQALLQKLQQQFQQQQLTLQQELMRQSNALQKSQAPTAHLTQLTSSSSIKLDKQEKEKAKGRQPSKRDSASGINLANIGRRMGGGKGKRLSSLEQKIPHSGGDAPKSDNLEPIDPFSSNRNKRSASEGTPMGGSLSKQPKLPSVPSEFATDPPPPAAASSSSSQNRERVLEQGDSDHTTSLIPSISPEYIKSHLKSLEGVIHLSPKAVTQKCLPVIRRLLSDQFGWVFRDPVDPGVLGLPDYFEVVKNPMHLALIEKKLENNLYKDLGAVIRDTKLVFENAILYNGEDSEVGGMAKTMIDRFMNDYNKVVSAMKDTKEYITPDGDVCSLCNNQRRLFQPTVLYCSGVCGMQKIRRKTFYYTDRTKSNYWCVSCYEKLDDDEPISLDNGNEVKKKDLQKKKNDAVPEEAWVQCDTCESWVHQICALFNGRKNKSAASYLCPKCHLKKRLAGEVKAPEEPLKAANELPHCEMSKVLQKGLEGMLAKAYVDRASKVGKSIAEVEKVEGLAVRVISNMEKKHVVRDEMYNRYSKQGCPSEFPVRSKCIALFQKIHGVDVIIFGMYVFEYNHACPAPNRRRVYISYLDSIQYFEPTCYRTITYHALLVEYLRYVKDRGFHTAHIWSCPPTPGDDYIFHCHPSKQQIPREDMLRKWYFNMLEKAKDEGIVLETRTLHEEYFDNKGANSTLGQASDPTCLPYFEGDYIPGELENIIKDVKADEEAKNKLKDKDGTPQTNTTNKGGKKVGTRSNPGELVNVAQDKVMMRLAQAMTNMKHNFIVAHLRSREFAAAVERGEDVSGWTEADEGLSVAKRPKIGGKNSPGMVFPGMRRRTSGRKDGREDDKARPIVKEVPLKPADDGERKDGAPKKDDDDANSIGSISLGLKDDSLANSFGLDDSDKSARDDSLDPIALDDFEPEPYSLRGGGTESTMRAMSSNQSRAANKRGFDDIEPAIARFAAANANNERIGDTSDPDDPQEIEMFESRQQFLNYCSHNHFQFDELRRAKHTTMMVLFQLHNPNAPMFVAQCGACYGEIIHGTRYHCNTCANFDLCEDCYKPVTSGEWAGRGTRYQHDSSHTFAPIDVEASEDEQKNREERHRQVKLHLELLQHASTCDGSCSINNCSRMKKLINHVKTCDVTPKRSCGICTKILVLLTMHARMCSQRGHCPMPYCDRIREKMNRRRQLQQLMDDRRRKAQNKLYRNSGGMQ